MQPDEQVGHRFFRTLRRASMWLLALPALVVLAVVIPVVAVANRFGRPARSSIARCASGCTASRSRSSSFAPWCPTQSGRAAPFGPTSQRQPHHPCGTLAAPVAAGRAAPGDQHPPRRHELHWPPARAPRVRGRAGADDTLVPHAPAIAQVSPAGLRCSTTTGTPPTTSGSSWSTTFSTSNMSSGWICRFSFAPWPWCVQLRGT